VSVVFEVEPTKEPYVIVPCTFETDIFATFQIVLITNSENLEFVTLSKTPPNVDATEYARKLQEGVFQNLLKRRADRASEELIALVDAAVQIGVTELSQVSTELKKLVQKLQTTLATTKLTLEAPVQTEEVDEAPSGPVGGPAPPPPPPPSGEPKPGSKGAVVTEENEGRAMLRKAEPGQPKPRSLDPTAELLNMITSGRVCLKPAKERKLAEKPKVEDPCAFNVEKIMARRKAIEDMSDEEVDNTWDDDDEWND